MTPRACSLAVPRLSGLAAEPSDKRHNNANGYVMTDEPTDKKAVQGRTLAGTVEIGKNALALLRDFVLFVLAMLLLVYPTKLNDILTRAGFEEGSIVGFKWKAKLIDSDAALKEAMVTINDLTAQLDKTSKALAEAQPKLTDPTTKESLARIEKENADLRVTSSRVQLSVARTIADNAPLVEAAQDAIATGSWGVVFSGDASIDGAKYEVNVVARKLGLRNAAIYYRQGVYRSVSLADDRSEAQESLSKAKQRRSDAYIVRMSSWCSRTEQRDGYRECVAPEGQ